MKTPNRRALAHALYIAGVRDAERLLSFWLTFVPSFRELFVRDAYRQFYLPGQVEMNFIEGFEETIRESQRSNIIIAMEIARARVEEAKEKRDGRSEEHG